MNYSHTFLFITRESLSDSFAKSSKYLVYRNDAMLIFLSTCTKRSSSKLERPTLSSKARRPYLPINNVWKVVNYGCLLKQCSRAINMLLLGHRALKMLLLLKESMFSIAIIGRPSALSWRALALSRWALQAEPTLTQSILSECQTTRIELRLW